ncbi:MAG TPA: YfdX family protein [Hellea balneolensis]|uniref:YfdX family protein n=1 Tax=Hellea balneolensis TaxID=287478 RepID=A0A7C5LU71_9PROT|nr:YfdX family protein [Hellea balneolensis]
MKKQLLTTTLLALCAFTPLATPAYAADANTNTQAKIENQSIDTAMGAADLKIVDDAVVALDNIDLAISAIKAKDKITAKSKLETALGKLETVLSLDPALGLVPVSQEHITLDAYHDAKAVKTARRVAMGYLRRGMVQDARLLIKDMASELDIRTTSIPLATYSEAIKLALPLVADEEFDAAEKILNTALNTIVIRDQIIPLPVIRMTAALEAAKKIEAENKVLTSDQKEDVIAALDYAEDQMELAEALGYVSKDGYKLTHKVVKKIRKNLESKTSNTANYDEVLSASKKTNDTITSAQDRADKRAQDTVPE